MDVQNKKNNTAEPDRYRDDRQGGELQVRLVHRDQHGGPAGWQDRRHPARDPRRPLDDRPCARHQDWLLQASYEAGGAGGGRLGPQEHHQEGHHQEARRLSGGLQLQQQLLLAKRSRQGRA